jgi:hypothetical protein
MINEGSQRQDKNSCREIQKKKKRKEKKAQGFWSRDRGIGSF